ncbi:flagellar protein MotY [Echinimonas agarilytica]|uniref:OmpA family protein n=1 Tax=Echinimonas agarilytica TaxID=1215918 RepID=A0AA42B8G1_9GAMM|nr:OmpA family protein [Echinimonas agarilytica]
MLLAAPTEAALRQYQAPLASSDWVMSKSTPLACQLEHAIPRFGTAKFHGEAGTQNDINMTMDAFRQPRATGFAQLVAVPPAYKPGLEPAHLATLKVLEGFDPSLNPKLSWSVLTELEQGNNPTFYYRDGYRKGGEVSVALNSANFRSGYADFVECVGGLLPFGFDDVALTVLNYRSNSDRLELESQRRLRRVAEYVVNDPAIVKINIDAYSDSYGGRWLNLELSKKRANAIREFLIEQGVDDDKLVSSGYGERRHISSNETPLGRQKNRRVVMRLTRDASLDDYAEQELQAEQSAGVVQAAATQTAAPQ